MLELFSRPDVGTYLRKKAGTKGGGGGGMGVIWDSQEIQYHRRRRIQPYICVYWRDPANLLERDTNTKIFFQDTFFVIFITILYIHICVYCWWVFLWEMVCVCVCTCVTGDPERKSTWWAELAWGHSSVPALLMTVRAEGINEWHYCGRSAMSPSSDIKQRR